MTICETHARRHWSDDLLREPAPGPVAGASVESGHLYFAPQRPKEDLTHIRLSGQPLKIEGLSSESGHLLLSGGQLSSPYPRWLHLFQGASSLGLWTPLLLYVDEGDEIDGPIETEPAPWLSSVAARLDALLRLPQDWDGYGGAPISAEQATRALDFLLRLMRPTTARPAIGPLSDGGLQVDWHRGQLDVEVMFSEGPNAGLYWLDLETGHEFEGPIDTGIEGLRRLMDRLEGDLTTTTHVAA
jgi:hypothetical protein